MALKKEHRLPHGYNVHYWKLIRVTMNYPNREAMFTLAGYKDEQTAKLPNASLITRDIRVKGDEFDNYFKDKKMPLISQVYKAARTKDPMFSDALDT